MSGWSFECPCGWTAHADRPYLEDLQAKVLKHAADHRSDIRQMIERNRSLQP